jgi:hypothetical protein
MTLSKADGHCVKIPQNGQGPAVMGLTVAPERRANLRHWLLQCPVRRSSDDACSGRIGVDGRNACRGSGGCVDVEFSNVKIGQGWKNAAIFFKTSNRHLGYLLLSNGLCD